MKRPFYFCPPPESAVERRWFEENRSSSYSAEELIVATA
ncbi:hypothetical protein GFS60_01296 [Rhodococcus sp. WAY2]|nr:hypothetical protein GFS60_01296 [Rhodococcus sp. WAY2]